MKPFAVGAKVEILYSPNDRPATWVAGEVAGIVKPNIAGMSQSGNSVRIAKGKFIEVTEPVMIREVS